MKASDMMTKAEEVLSFTPDDTLVSVARGLASKGVSGAPVVENGIVVGVISETDLIPLVKDERKGRKMKTREVMTDKVVSVRPSSDLAEIARAMVNHKVNRVMVLGRSGELVGLIARDDLMKAALSEL
jgi:CBS domain-containing protein